MMTAMMTTTDDGDVKCLFVCERVSSDIIYCRRGPVPEAAFDMQAQPETETRPWACKHNPRQLPQAAVRHAVREDPELRRARRPRVAPWSVMSPMAHKGAPCSKTPI